MELPPSNFRWISRWRPRVVQGRTVGLGRLGARSKARVPRCLRVLYEVHKKASIKAAFPQGRASSVVLARMYGSGMGVGSESPVGIRDAAPRFATTVARRLMGWILKVHCGEHARLKFWPCGAIVHAFEKLALILTRSARGRHRALSTLHVSVDRLSANACWELDRCGPTSTVPRPSIEESPMSTELSEDLQAREPRVKVPNRTRRPDRYQAARKCREAFERFRRDVLMQPLPGLHITVATALSYVDAFQVGERPRQAVELANALATVGLTVDAASCVDEASSPQLHVRVEPNVLRQAYPGLSCKYLHPFALSLTIDGAQHEAPQHDECDRRNGREGSRYAGGVSDEDELRLQIEILRIRLPEFGITVDEALDELIDGLTNVDQERIKRCSRLALAIEQLGLRFHPVRKSWRLPRLGVLLIVRPAELERTAPELAFLEAHQLGHVVVVDRPERAGREMRQGLLF